VFDRFILFTSLVVGFKWCGLARTCESPNALRNAKEQRSIKDLGTHHTYTTTQTIMWNSLLASRFSKLSVKINMLTRKVL
jgi:hypothetical protein